MLHLWIIGTGKGRMSYPDGSYYEGEFGNGMRAKGRYVSNDGTLEYVGAWRKDLQHGQGVLIRKNVLKYTGAPRSTSRCEDSTIAIECLLDGSSI